MESDKGFQEQKKEMIERVKDVMRILSSVAIAPPECAQCVAFCTEGRISCECRGDFHPDTCENSLSYDENKME